MPIRINLLAEAQAAEESRRRDPFRFFIYGGIVVVALTFAVYSWFQLKVVVANRGLTQIQNQIQVLTNDNQRVVSNLKTITEDKAKLVALQKLTANRFLEGNLFNALQMATVDGVSLTRLRVQQSYSPVKKGKRTNIVESVVVFLDAQDAGKNPGDQVNKFKDVIANQTYFKTMLSPTNGVLLTGLSAPQNDPNGRPFVSFTVECHYPDYTR
ncbi:MAG TPA: hypothetical protein VHG89_11770 [Verrucomicrobiae bacterium]|nr:hypothetical protein [Verrucomicrobiae bacterium]